MLDGEAVWVVTSQVSCHAEQTCVKEDLLGCNWIKQTSAPWWAHLTCGVNVKWSHFLASSIQRALRSKPYSLIHMNAALWGCSEHSQTSFLFRWGSAFSCHTITNTCGASSSTFLLNYTVSWINALKILKGLNHTTKKNRRFSLNLMPLRIYTDVLEKHYSLVDRKEGEVRMSGYETKPLAVKLQLFVSLFRQRSSYRFDFSTIATKPWCYDPKRSTNH